MQIFLIRTTTETKLDFSMNKLRVSQTFVKFLCRNCGHFVQDLVYGFYNELLASHRHEVVLLEVDANNHEALNFNLAAKAP